MSNDSHQSEPASASPLAGLASKIRSGKSAAQAEYEATPPKLSITYRKTGSPKRGITDLLIAMLSVRRLLRMLAELFGDLAKPVLSPPLNVELDGVIVGTIEEGRSLDFVTTAGPHRLHILSTVCSATCDLDLTNGQRLRFWCLTSISGVVFQRAD